MTNLRNNDIGDTFGFTINMTGLLLTKSGNDACRYPKSIDEEMNPMVALDRYGEIYTF